MVGTTNARPKTTTTVVALGVTSYVLDPFNPATAEPNRRFVLDSAKSVDVM